MRICVDIIAVNVYLTSYLLDSQDYLKFSFIVIFFNLQNLTSLMKKIQKVKSPKYQITQVFSSLIF